MLTLRKIEAIKPEGDRKIVVHDGDGLYLSSQRTKAGGIGRSWIFRYSLKVKITSANGKEYRAQRQIGLGAYPAVGIQEARELRREAAVLARQGIDPREEWKRRLAEQASPPEPPPEPKRIRRKLGPPPDETIRTEASFADCVNPRKAYHGWLRNSRMREDPKYVERRNWMDARTRKIRALTNAMKDGR